MHHFVSLRGFVFLSAMLAIPRSPSFAETRYNPQQMMSVTIGHSVLGSPAETEFLRTLVEIGQVVIIDRQVRGLPWLASAGVLIGAPVEKTYAVITDYARYPEFMPQTEGARVKQLAPNLYDVEFDVVIRLVYIPISVPFQLYQYNQPPLRTDWVSKNPDYALNYGYWQLAPVDNRTRTLAFYSLYTRAKQGLVNRLFQLEPSLEMLACMSTATMVTRAVKTRVETLYRQAGGKVAPPPPKPKFGVVQVLQQNPQTGQAIARKGRLLVLEEGKPFWSNVVAIFNRPPEEVWEYLVRVEDQIDPRVKATVLQRDQKSMTVRFNLEIYLLLSFNLEYTLRYQLDKPRRISWTTVGEGNVKGVAGSWDLIPLENGTKTLALYRCTVDLQSMGYLMQALLRVEPTFELALQASQALLAVDNLDLAMSLTPEQRQKWREKKKRDAEESKKLPIPK